MIGKSKYVAPQAVRITVNGKTVKYQTHAEAARANNVLPGTLSLRLKKGWTIKQALGLSPPPKDAYINKKVQLGDTVFNSITDAAKHYGIKRSIVYNRLRKGWSTRQSLGIDSQPPHKKPEGKRISVKVMGKIETFNSITDAARHFCLTPKVVQQRLITYGWTPEQALEIVEPPLGARVSKPIKIKKENTIIAYKSLKDAVDAFNLNYDVVKQRINKLGWTPEQAFELEAPPKHAKGCLGYIYIVTNKKNNKVYIGQTKTTVDVRWQQHIETALRTKHPKEGSLHSAIQEYGENGFTCDAIEAADSIDKLNRLERKYIINYKSLDPAHGYNLSRGGSGLTGGKEVVVQGKKFDSLASAARAFGVKSSIAHQRINTNGYTIEQALEIEPPPEGSGGPKIIVVNDGGKKKEFISNIAAAGHYGVPYKVFHSRLRADWSVEEALGLEKRPERIHKGKSLTIKYKGKLKHYPSLAEAAKYFGVPSSRVQARLKRGWSLEEALEIEKRERKTRKEVNVRHKGKLKHYSTIAAASRDFGLKPSTVLARISLGWSLEEALGIK